MIYTNAKCMVYLTISIYTLFKDFTIILVAAGEYVLYKKKLDINTIIAFTLILLSSSLAKFSCPNTSIYGYCWCILNILSTSSYILLYKYNLSTGKDSNSEAVFYCNFLSIPFLLFGFAIIDSKDFRLCSLNSSALGIFFLILLSSISAFFISYTTAWCLRLLSSTSYSVLGAINKIIVSFSGILIIGEGRVSALKILSLIIGSLAGIIYSKRIKNE
ncbi:GDP-mannose transporter into the lumen of the Golgi [Gurleya vavrai]